MDHAEHFKIWEKDDNRILVVFGSSGLKDTVGVFLCHASMSTGMENERGSISMEVPLRRVVVRSTTHLPFIQRLGVLDHVVAAATPEAVRDAETRRELEGNHVATLAQDPSAQQEQLIVLDPDAVLDVPFGSVRTISSDHMIIPVCEYLEPHPLGRAEWLRFFGVLLDKEHLADSVFQTIREKYDASKATVEGIPGPSVFFGSAWRGSWTVPPGNSYMATLIADAGGRYLYANTTAGGNLTLTMEEVLADTRRSDAWGMIVDVPGTTSREQLFGMDPRVMSWLKDTPVFIANSAKADVFGTALLEPDVMLQDLITLFHGAADGHVPTYFERVDQ